MILKELAFDMPLVNEKGKIKKYAIEENINEEITRRDFYNQVWKDKRIMFMNESEMVCEKIKKKMPRIITNKTWKLEIHCMTAEDYKPYCYNCEICEISVLFDFEKYNSSCDEDKVYLQLEALENAILYANKVGIKDYEPLLEICKDLKSRHFYNNTFVWKKKKISKEYDAYVVLEHTLKNMNIYIEIKNKKGVIVHKKLIAQDNPSPICYHTKLGCVEVLDNKEIVLYNKLKTKSYKMKIPTDIQQSSER